MKYIYIFYLFLSCCFGYSQKSTLEPEIEKYYFEVKNLQFLPNKIVVNNNVKLFVSDPDLEAVFSSFFIKDFSLAFPGTKRELLLRTYIIECEEGLFEILNRDYSGLYNLVKVPEVFPLILPNDDYFDGGNGQPELLFINADLAWDLTTGDGVIIGIAENVNTYQEDLVGLSENINNFNPNPNSVGHGTQVALIAAANTNNSIGMASVGFKSYLKCGSGYGQLIPLAQSGARVINMSWGSCQVNPVIYENVLIDEVWEDYNVVLVAAAGNGSFSCPSGPQYNHFPASFNNVISVTNVGHQYEIGDQNFDQNFWKNIFLRTDPPYYATYNVNVDLSAPGRNILTASSNNPNVYSYGGGTSYSAPIVSGTVALMFSVNPCLYPNEIESILKLTTFKNDMISLNLPYNGLIGSGVLDTYKAVKMAQDMKSVDGTVVINDRIIDRWNFVLKTNPYNILLVNNYVTNNATIDFSAKNSIVIESGDYFPTTDDGFVNLTIDQLYDECNVPYNENVSGRFSENEKKELANEMSIGLTLYPNPNDGDFKLVFNEKISEEIEVNIFDVFGKLVYSLSSKESEIDFKLNNLNSGVYFVKIISGEINESIKFIKK
ncbi:S8 family serine peptidase [Flavobacterium sp.]|uniref:S8 family serine peptidase n=1 Tax=Flavobacterium sp. TaxID=239 RepID=UPI0039E41FA8